MTTHNPSNERIKREYFTYLKEASHRSEATVDAVAEALARFETYTSFKDFGSFHRAQAIAFKNQLGETINQRTSQLLSKATRYAVLSHLKRFFQWLALEPGYRSRLRPADADYFNLVEKDARVATARREKSFPSLEDVRQVIRLMPNTTEIDRRNRALIAFTLLTAARDGAIASLKLKHVDLTEGSVDQDAREVNTKFGKTFKTYFFPVGDEALGAFEQWVTYLRKEKRWNDDDPLFPATAVSVGAARKFEVVGVKRAHWRNASPIRKIFKAAFKQAGLRYYNPHSIRDTLVSFAGELCGTAEQFKAVSQNLGHEKPITTLRSYGPVSSKRQGELVKGLGANLRETLARSNGGSASEVDGLTNEELMAVLANRLRHSPRND